MVVNVGIEPTRICILHRSFTLNDLLLLPTASCFVSCFVNVSIHKIQHAACLSACGLIDQSSRICPSRIDEVHPLLLCGSLYDANHRTVITTTRYLLNVSMFACPVSLASYYILAWFPRGRDTIFRLSHTVQSYCPRRTTCRQEDRAFMMEPFSWRC